MRYYLDTEFIERPCTIDLISIALVCEDGRELYLESDTVNWIYANEFVLAKVKPNLTGLAVDPWDIKRAVRGFVGKDRPEFWADYGAYDWVAFCWLFGCMVDLPKGWPMFVRDFQQLKISTGFEPSVPSPSTHNALDDARWLMRAHGEYMLLQEMERDGE